MRWSRKCEKCQRWTREAMFLIRQETICAECGKKEILRWNEMVNAMNILDRQCSVALAAVGGVQEAESRAGCVAGVDSLNPRRMDDDKNASGDRALDARGL